MNCFICQKPLDTQIHARCNRLLYGHEAAPIMPYTLDSLSELALELVQKQSTIAGVQKKMSLHLDQDSKKNKLTFVGLWGQFILKPPVEAYPYVPENEALTMNLANALGIQTVPHGLIPLQSGELAYITRRIDRPNLHTKLAMEDMCQLSERLSEDKYKGSMEQIAKLIGRYSNNTVFDLLRFFELCLFIFLTANSDMHLKNFSLISNQHGISLAPAYDLLNTRLVISEKDDPDEFALSIHGKRSRLKIEDFVLAGQSFGLSDKQIYNVCTRFKKKYPQIIELIESSFLPVPFKEKYKEIFCTRWERLF